MDSRTLRAGHGSRHRCTPGELLRSRRAPCRSDFQPFTKIPIVIYYGDNIPDEPGTNPGQEQWRAFRAIARQWRDVVNRHGGDVTLVEWPSGGIRGNTHFLMSDLNSVQIADLLSKFLADKKLD